MLKPVKIMGKLGEYKCIRLELTREKYSNGDKVYFNRKNYKGWKGPRVLLGKDERKVLVKQLTNITANKDWRLKSAEKTF